LISASIHHPFRYHHFHNTPQKTERIRKISAKELHFRLGVLGRNRGGADEAERHVEHVDAVRGEHRANAGALPEVHDVPPIDYDIRFSNDYGAFIQEVASLLKCAVIPFVDRYFE